MRQLKFRIWDKKYNMFDNGSPDLFISTDGEVYEKDERIYGMETIVEYDKMDHYEVNQWTGLKDKNGKEIYEGDIVKVKYSYEQNYLGGFAHDEVIGHVKFNHGCFDVYRNNVDQGIVIREHISDLEAEWEVIGNIYEHPHLLEESK